MYIYCSLEWCHASTTVWSDHMWSAVFYSACGTKSSSRRWRPPSSTPHTLGMQHRVKSLRASCTELYPPCRMTGVTLGLYPPCMMTGVTNGHVFRSACGAKSSSRRWRPSSSMPLTPRLRQPPQQPCLQGYLAQEKHPPR